MSGLRTHYSTTQRKDSSMGQPLHMYTDTTVASQRRILENRNLPLTVDVKSVKIGPPSRIIQRATYYIATTEQRLVDVRVLCSFMGANIVITRSRMHWSGSILETAPIPGKILQVRTDGLSCKNDKRYYELNIQPLLYVTGEFSVTSK